jgi:hypothetical protein
VKRLYQFFANHLRVAIIRLLAWAFFGSGYPVQSTDELWSAVKKKFYQFLVYNLWVVIALLIGWVTFIFIRGVVEDQLYDNHLHHLACWQLPDAQEVQAVKDAHSDTIARIKAIHPDHIGFEADTETCPGKGFFVIEYPTHAERLKIEEIMGGDRFFGIPCNLINN